MLAVRQVIQSGSTLLIDSPGRWDACRSVLSRSADGDIYKAAFIFGYKVMFAK